nr:ribonuclease H-like domain-containing protein [Tanacetum cinerariifolium]
DTTKEELVTQKEKIEIKSTQSSTTAKLPLLKQGDYEMWRLRIKQYFQIQDYALWDVIENGNSLKPVAEITTDDAGTSTTLIPGPVTIKEKAKKNNDVKAISMLLMALPNEHLMTFNQYKDAKTLFATIETRFDLDTMSLDDLYNNLKIVEQEVRVTTSTNTSSQNMSFVSSPSPNGTNEVPTIFGKTGKKITINGSDTAGYDKAKVECFNCHKMGILHESAEDIKIKDSEIVVLKSKLEKISNEKDALETKIEKFENASQSLDKLIGSQVTDNIKKGLGYVSYNVVPPPHTGRFLPLIIDLSHTGLQEFAEPSVQSYGVKPIKVVTQKSSVKISAPVKENNGVPLIEDRESDEEDEGYSHKQIEDQGYFNSGCSQHMTGNIYYLTDFKEFNGGYVAFREGDKGGKITGKGTIRTGKLDFKDVYFVNELQFNLFSVS